LIKKIIIAALCCIFVAACQTTPRVSSKTHIEHKEYGIMPKTDGRYTLALDSCENKVYSSGHQVFGVNVKSKEELLAVMNKRKAEIKASKNSTKQEQQIMVAEMLSDLSVVVKITNTIVSCLESKGFTQV